jgi:hypothetical protein
MFATTLPWIPDVLHPEADSEILRFYSMITADLASAVTEAETA